MNMKYQALPKEWVERIFSRLTGIYGSEFSRKYSGNLINGVDLELENAKQVWGEELGYFADKPDSLSYVLHHAPSKAPNLVEFKDMAMKAPKRSEVIPIEKKFTPEQIAENKKRMANLISEVLSK